MGLRRIFIIGILILSIGFASHSTTTDFLTSNFEPQVAHPSDTHTSSSVEGIGNSLLSAAGYSRNINNLQFSLANSYSDSESHNQIIDLSSYHIDGWSLYEVEISTTRIVALAEREIIGSRTSPGHILFNISKYDTGYYDQLTQGFYGMSHDGKLENISLLYTSSSYDPLYHHYAYFDLRSDYSDGATNMVSSVPLGNVGLTPTWASVTESTTLDADTIYYAVMNGTRLIEVFGTFPIIQWYYEDSEGTYETRRHTTEYIPWSSSRPYEALLNYTYIPWNTTSNSALEFSDPSIIDLRGNSSLLAGSQWKFDSLTNVSQIQFSSNQSISVEYDLTLRYKQSVTSSTSWYADSSNSVILWNITTSIDYPELAGSQDRNLTVLVPSDWTASHLFNITYPTQYFDHFTQIESSVNCFGLADETWILECTSPNYMKSLSMFDTSDDSIITDKVSISVTMDINATIEDQSSNPAANGNAHLVVYYQAAEEYSDDYSVTSGTSHYQWDISTDSSSNGLHTIDVYWSNGTEVGYQSNDVVVFYETTLVADEYTINDYTDDSFYIGIDYNQVFPAAGIDSSSADVTYSFGSVVNQSLTDQSNGRWDATVSTASMSPGLHTLTIYAEGYALENRSITIDVDLIHDTLPLTIIYSNISYVETTELSVAYERVGNIPIPDAHVEVTIGTTTWQLNFDEGSGTYKMIFNGTDIDPGFGIHTLTINASLAGYKSQSYTKTLIIHEESTILNIEWSGSTDITYVESVTLYVDYQMSNTTPIYPATVEVTIDTDIYVMNWNGGTGRYWYQFNGSDLLPGFGFHNLIIKASKFGYAYRSDLTQTLNITEEPTTLVLSWSNGNEISYVTSTMLIAKYNQSNGSPLINATVSVTIDTESWLMVWNTDTFAYELTFNGTDSIPGFGTFDVSVLASLYGFESKPDDNETLYIHEESTLFNIEWSGSTNITYVESVTLYIDYQMSNATPIYPAIVEVIIDTDIYVMNWNGGTGRYWYQFNGSDLLPGFGFHNLIIEASKFGYQNYSNIFQTLNITEEPTTLVLSWSNTNSITYVTSTTLIAKYNQSNGSPVINATVSVTIDTESWLMVWNTDTFVYELTFNGTDSIPGFGSFNISVIASLYGFELKPDDNETLFVDLEPTSITIAWSNTGSITYIDQTTLIVSYRMNNNSVIPIDAVVNVTIDGFPTWDLDWDWDYGTETYRLVFNGTDIPPGFGTHNLTIRIGKYGYVNHVNTTLTLTIDLVPTIHEVYWSNTNSITYIESTTLTVNYTMTNGTPVTDAIVNVSTVAGFWLMKWNNDTFMYELAFNGTDSIPGFGTHILTIQIRKVGYSDPGNLTETLILDLEPTSMNMAWLDSPTISFLESTTLVVYYRMSNTSPILDATVIATIDGIQYELVLHPSGSYRYTFSGTDNLPGIGTHLLKIDANRTGFDSKSDEGEVLIINEESTFIDIIWLDNNTITFVETSILVINYTMTNGSPIAGATVNATIDGFPAWDLVWDIDTQTYRLTFNGTDVPPGLGFHNITIRADKFGYESRNGLTNITLDREQSYLVVSWIPDNDISYMTSSILVVSYRMTNSSPISEATVNVSIGEGSWLMKWSVANQDYRLQINGTDIPPDLGNYTMTIEATMFGFYAAYNLTAQVILREEPTSLDVHWANGINNPSFLSYTYLIADYLYGDSTPIVDAILNVSINSFIFRMGWNASGFYQLKINGSDTYLGVGNNSITISAEKYGYVTKMNTTKVVIPVVPTKLTLEWEFSDTITYVEYTTLHAYYVMYNDSLISEASVNVTINGMTLPMIWSSSSNSYERTFYGSDSSLGITSFPILVEAAMIDFQSLSNSDEILTIQTEPTTLAISWIGGDNITYFQQTTLSVQFVMSNGSPISIGVLNATIGGVLFDLNWNIISEAYEVVIYGDDARLDYLDYDVLINASAYGFVASVDTYQYFTIRLEDTYLVIDWVPSNTISYLDSTVFRIFYRYASNHSPVLGAVVSASTWVANYNSSSGAYEIIFTGSDFPTPIPGTHSLDVVASKSNHQSHTNDLEEITITKESTYIESWWLNDNNTITFVENTTIYINYSIAASGVSIVDANVTVRIGTTIWDTLYNPILELYYFTFIGDMDPPGLGVHGLFISASYSFHEGYQSAVDNSQILEIESASVSIDSYWIVSGTITYLQQTTLVVNYTLLDGEAIPLALVNVTIGQTFWYAQWDELSETYRLTFNGSDSLPGLGFHELSIRANRTGFDSLTDSSMTLNIIEESTTTSVLWSNSDSITYFEHTYLFVRYRMSNGSDILGASVNATIGSTKWILIWNSTQGAYGVLFKGWDSPPGLGSHSILINATKHGFAYIENSVEVLTLLKDPTTIQVSWSNGNNITYVETTTIIVQYKMSNGTPISTGTVIATIGLDSWELLWNVSSQVYYFTFYGNMSPPGLDTFSVQIDASSAIFASQSTSEFLTLREEGTVTIVSWTTATFDWTQNVVIGIEYRDSYGRLVSDATQKTISVDGSEFTLSGTNGTYWYSFNNSFGLGHHNVVMNISKFGYEFAVNATVSFDIIEASTSLELVWSMTTIDYLGQITLTVDYTYTGTGDSIPVGLVNVNITIDGITTLNLTPIGDYWTITLNGDFLDLGTHSVVILAQAYGYNFAEDSDSLTVNEVSTGTSGISWSPSDLTIEFTGFLQLVVDYTYASGDVPDTATVNVTIDGHFYELDYLVGAWRVTIPGSILGVDVFDAHISAWLHGYELQTFTTSGINVTLAANSFYVTWDPSDLTPTYIDTVTLTVAYIQDFEPIEDATVQLFINGTRYELIYSSIDERWFLSIDASDIDLGVWNVTVTANKTGYAEGFQMDLLTVVEAPTILDIQDTGDTLYFDETTTIDIYYQLTNTSAVPGAIISFTLDGIEQTITWNGYHWTTTLDGTELGVGVYTYNIITSVYGYETQMDTFVITILSVPTSMISDSSIVMYARDFVSFRFTYIDERTSTSIDASEFNITWIEYYNIVTLPNYTYIITIGGNDFHTGNYTFELTLGRVGFDNSTGAISIEARPIPVEFIMESTYTQYENETLNIEFQLIDTVHSSLIDWGYLIVELEGAGYLAIFESVSSSYIVNFRLPMNMDPGSYILYFYSWTEDCVEITEPASLEVLAKHTYILSIDAIDQIQSGNDLTITITAMEGTEFASGIALDITIVVTLSQGGQQFIVEQTVTDSNGLAIIIFEVPDNAVELEVSASFDGSISEWPALSSIKSVEVTPAGTGGTGLIIPDPLVLSIIFGGISVSILALAFRRKRRGSGSAVSVSVHSTAPILPPSSPATGIQQQLREEILNSEEGITRAELSRKLGASASKVGSMVKDLLDSDSGFFEVKEGAKKLIKFKKSG